MKKQSNNNFPIIIFSMLFIIGLAIMFYPSICSLVNSMKYNDTILSYNEVVEGVNENNEFLEAAKKYNDQLTSTTLTDAFTNPQEESSSSYKKILNIDDSGIMGYIEIPKIEIKIPIYHGTGSDALENGVGHLEGSSLPIGGVGTHAILSAHRGLPTSRLFTDLDQLWKGDKFYIYILNEVLAYEVDQVLVVEPHDTEALMIDNDGDYITLVTCTPYAVNTHRLLVRGKRVDYVENAAKEKRAAYISLSDLCLSIGIWSVDLVLIGAIIILKRSYKKMKIMKEIEVI